MPNSTSDFAARVRDTLRTGTAVEDHLETNDRIIARVTDGIYREPWSAFRELVSNAYDADATRVTIDCDYPFFRQIKISDNGNGMDIDTISDLVKNIGGSSKRTARGRRLGTVGTDPTESPNGRKLIGKIGIGLFAVAQLTQHFQIISKRKDSNERVIATVKIHTFEENSLASSEEAEKQVTGKVSVFAEHTPDMMSHGTTIVLLDIKPGVRSVLQSRDLWQVLDDQKEDHDLGLVDSVIKPTFHIGVTNDNGDMVTPPALPWSETDEPRTKFKKLFDQTVRVGAKSSDRADLSHLDNYLKLLWRLSLGSPLQYIYKHPFEFSTNDKITYFQLSNRKKGKAEKLSLDDGATLRDQLDLCAGQSDPLNEFSVFIDGVQLSRPVQISDQLMGSQDLGQPMMFIGKASTEFGGAETTRSGGPLSFEAYLYWNSKIVPKESIGALLRVNGASGTLFDPEFLGYQISEQTRKKQVTCEIFVLEGLDGALNIDRESYNTSHPHYMFIQKWLHNAFRQFATQHKSYGKAVREEKKQVEVDEKHSRIENQSMEIWDRMRGQDSLPAVETIEIQNGLTLPSKVSGNELLWTQSRLNLDKVKSPEVVNALSIVLDAYGVLEHLDDAERSGLIYDIIDIFSED